MVWFDLGHTSIPRARKLQNVRRVDGMTTVSCGKQGCTITETGICLLSHAPPSECPNYRAIEEADGLQPTSPNSSGDPIPQAASIARQFPLGLELGSDDAAAIMASRYAHLIGVLGSWDAGKTCFLLSLYMMASRGALPGRFSFAGSQTLPGFEARARRLREWKGGQLPAQLADHTSLAHPRQPALLHMALREASHQRGRFDVLLTDLPGEWSKNLVDRVDTAGRFAFLLRADGLIIVVDGPLLESKAKHAEIQRTKHLLDRLVDAVGIDTSTPLVLLISKGDKLNQKIPPFVGELEDYARRLGFQPHVILCAAFSTAPQQMKNGQGVFEALEVILLADVPNKTRSSSQEAEPRTGRAFLDVR